MTKRFLPTFSRFSEHDKPERTICKGLKGIPAVTVENFTIFLRDLKGRWNQTFQKLAVFTGTKDFGAFLFVLSIVPNHMEQDIGDHKVF